MKQLLTLIFFFSSISFSQAYHTPNFASDTISTIPQTPLEDAEDDESAPDTTFVPEEDIEPVLSYQNNLYKQRLDSITKDVPLNYNQYVQSYLDTYTSPNRKSQIARMLGLAQYYFPIYEKAFRESGIPEEIKYLSIIESALNPHAVSRVGATGLWQFMFSTAKMYGLDMNNYVDERKDPVQASYAAAAFLKDSYNEFGDWLLAIASYNCGKGNVARALARSGATDFWGIRSLLPAETRGYVPAFIAVSYIMNYHKEHDIHPKLSDYPSHTDTVIVDRFIALKEVAKALDVSEEALAALNPGYKKRIVNGTAEAPRRLIIPLPENDSFAALYETLTTEHIQPQRIIAAANDENRPSRGGSATIHKVKKGESLSTIATRYKVTVQDLKVWNNLKSTQVVAGQSLKVRSNVKSIKPAAQPSYITYKVQKGDTLSTIAAKFDGVSIQHIKTANGLKSTAITPGMILKIVKA
jgi:membrane-bound lytic murein transglycosylase D